MKVKDDPIYKDNPVHLDETAREAEAALPGETAPSDFEDRESTDEVKHAHELHGGADIQEAASTAGTAAGMIAGSVLGAMAGPGGIVMGGVAGAMIGGLAGSSAAGTSGQGKYETPDALKDDGGTNPNDKEAETETDDEVVDRKYEEALAHAEWRREVLRGEEGFEVEPPKDEVRQRE